MRVLPSALMRRFENHTTPTDSPNISDALRALSEAVDHYRHYQDAGDAVIEAWQDLSFDDRRYLGTSFPSLVNALIALENI